MNITTEITAVLIFDMLENLISPVINSEIKNTATPVKAEKERM